MYYAENRHVLFIVYDGIKNSVFTSQVLTPLLDQLNNEQNLEITLLSFEQAPLDMQEVIKKIPAHNRLHFVLCKKRRYWGRLSLLSPIYQCFRLLESIPCHEIIARGPLAGYIAYKAFTWLHKKHSAKGRLACQSIRVQARGLCAAENRYAYTKKKKKGLLSWLIMQYISRSLHALEQYIFGLKKNKKYTFDYSVESVSPALSAYLINEFKVYPAHVSLAHADIPVPFDKELVTEWRKKTRSLLKIPKKALVYCYNGSFKPWQCAEETIVYFAEQSKKEPLAFLLILSPDKNDFIAALRDLNIEQSRYIVCSVNQEELYQYLAAADIGILFRDKDIINWVARPTKILEYEAVGLTVLHNNTVAWLTKNKEK